MRHRKGAIELSINFLVILIVSIAILSGGLVLFFKLKAGAQGIVGALSEQIDEELKKTMINNNYNVALWPNQIELSGAKSELVGIGVTSTLPNNQVFYIPTTVNLSYYATPSSNPINSIVYANTDMPNELRPEKWKIRFRAMSGSAGNLANISPQGQYTTGILVTAPKNPPKGEYVISFRVMNTSRTGTCLNCQPYGITKLYILVE